MVPLTQLRSHILSLAFSVSDSAEVPDDISDTSETSNTSATSQINGSGKKKGRKRKLDDWEQWKLTHLVASAGVSLSQVGVSMALCATSEPDDLSKIPTIKPLVDRKTATRYILRHGLAVLCWYAQRLSECTEFLLAFDGCTVEDRQFLLIRLGGVLDNKKDSGDHDNDKVFFLLCIAQLTKGGGAFIETQLLDRALSKFANLQRYLGIEESKVIKPWKVMALVADNASVNTGMLTGIFHRFELSRRRQYQEAGLPESNYVPMVGIGCFDHILNLVVPLFNKWLAVMARKIEPLKAFLLDNNEHLFATFPYRLHSYLANNRQSGLKGLAGLFQVSDVPFTRIKQGRYIATLLACEVIERHYMLIAIFLAYIYSDKRKAEQSCLHLFLSADFRALIHIGAITSVVFKWLMNKVVTLSTIGQLQKLIGDTLSFSAQWMLEPAKIFNLTVAEVELALRGPDNPSNKHQTKDNTSPLLEESAKALLPLVRTFFRV